MNIQTGSVESEGHDIVMPVLCELLNTLLMAILTELVAEGAMTPDQLHNEAVTMLLTGYEPTTPNNAGISLVGLTNQ